MRGNSIVKVNVCRGLTTGTVLERIQTGTNSRERSRHFYLGNELVTISYL
jgi:hypothetical protein